MADKTIDVLEQGASHLRLAHDIDGFHLSEISGPHYRGEGDGATDGYVISDEPATRLMAVGLLICWGHEPADAEALVDG